MCIVKSVKPGHKGTKDLPARYGASLLCVRYRFDEANRESLKTVELMIQRRSLKPEAECRGFTERGGRAAGAGRPRVTLRVGRRERELQSRVKSTGGRWDPVRRVWILRRDAAERLDFLGRVVGEGVYI